jgi:hypothetical protein
VQPQSASPYFGVFGFDNLLTSSATLFTVMTLDKCAYCAHSRHLLLTRYSWKDVVDGLSARHRPVGVIPYIVVFILISTLVVLQLLSVTMAANFSAFVRRPTAASCVRLLWFCDRGDSS